MSRPTHTLTCKEKLGERRGQIGAAWQQEDGSFTIVLNAGTVLDWKDEVTIKLFPIVERDGQRGHAERRPGVLKPPSLPEGKLYNPDDDIPF